MPETKLELVALAKDDYWAIFKQGREAWLIRPPFEARSMRQIAPDMIGVAIMKHGFEATEVSFSDIGDLVRYLTEQYLANRPAVQELALGRGLLESIPVETALAVLDRLEAKLAEPGVWMTGIDVVLELLSVQRLRCDARVTSRAMPLYSQLVDLREAARTKEQAFLTALTADEVAFAFPMASRNIGAAKIANLAQAISANRQILQL